MLKEKWAHFIARLRSLLQQSGFEADDSKEALLLFTFTHPYSAITALSNYISTVHRELNGQMVSGQPIPIQIIIHLSPGDEINPPYRNPDADLWEFLGHEVIHISRPLKTSWEQLMAQKPLPPCTFTNEGEGLFKLQFASDDIKMESLLSSRDLPNQGSEKPCFYCGMQSHRPGQCPSKLLTMNHDGLAAAGYLPFDQLNLAYQKVFTNPAAMTKILAAGINQAQIRKNPELMVFVGFLDINRVYQLRFLWHITFSRYSKWQSVFQAEPLQPDNKNLQLGLDCLRVGKYGQAEDFLLQECQPKSTRRFTAAIGLAFLTLEQRGLADMRNYLESAKSMATQPKERIYIDLLLARFYDLTGEIWKARDIVKNIIAANKDCPDAMYCKLQIEAKGNGSVEACQLVRYLIVDQRNFYLAALMDSSLIALQTKIEDLLSTKYGAIASSALGFLTMASHEISDLALWFDQHDQQMQANIAAVDSLQKCFERKSYFDVIDVEHKAKELTAKIRQLREAKLNELYEQINRVRASWERAYQFWMGYRYQVFFKDFPNRLLPVEKGLQEAHALAKKNEGAMYQKAVLLLHKAEQAMTAIIPMQNRMTWVCLACDSTISFSKKLVLTEIGGVLLTSAIFYGLGQLPGSYELTALVTDPLFQKKATILTAFLIAPLLALSWTIKGQLRR